MHGNALLLLYILHSRNSQTIEIIYRTAQVLNNCKCCSQHEVNSERLCSNEIVHNGRGLFKIGKEVTK